MTLATYFIIGVVVFAVVIVNMMINHGLGFIKDLLPNGWSWLVNIVTTALTWPVVVLCYTIGAIFGLLKRQKTEL